MTIFDEIPMREMILVTCEASSPLTRLSFDFGGPTLRMSGARRHLMSGAGGHLKTSYLFAE